MNRKPTAQIEARKSRIAELSVFEIRFQHSATAIKEAVWGPIVPWEDEYFRAKFDDRNTLNPNWSLIDWLSRYDER
jgi:hypothetical protein